MDGIMHDSDLDGDMNPEANYVPEGDGAGVKLGGVPNARGIGGYPTADGHRIRNGLFFRSAGLNFLGKDGLTDLRRLGIKEVVDLRDPSEIGLWPYRLPDDITVENIALIKQDNSGFDPSAAFNATDGTEARRAVETMSMADMYHDIVARSGREIVGIIKKPLDASECPMLIHCTAGKDRTGITSGVLMSLLGVSDDMVVSCYARSGANLGEAFRKAVMNGLAQDEDGAGQVSAAQTAALASPPELMRGVLAQLREDYGGVEAYCLENGMSLEDIAGLRELFIQ